MQIVRTHSDWIFPRLVQNPPYGSTNPWSEFCETFTSHFASRKRQPISTSVLSGVSQGNKDTMCAYII